MRIVDAQIHLFGPHAEEHAKRVRQVIMPPEDVVAAMDEAGVERAYLVPAGSAGNATCVEASRRWPEKFRTMGILGLDKPESRDFIADWPNAGWVGVRLSFPPFRKVSWLKDGTAEWFWPEANARKIPVMIWAPEQIDEVAKLAERFPHIPFIIDHLGLFVDDKDEKVGKVVEELLPLARFANIAAKATALPAHSTEAYPWRNLHPYIRQVVQAFGAQRVMWGTDLTRLDCTYQQAIDMFTKELDFLSAAELEQIMGGAVTSWIGW